MQLFLQLITMDTNKTYLLEKYRNNRWKFIWTEDIFLNPSLKV